jgi:hypothetical protein
MQQVFAILAQTVENKPNASGIKGEIHKSRFRGPSAGFYASSRLKSGICE